MEYKLRFPGLAADSAIKEPSPYIRRMVAEVNYERRARGFSPYLESPVCTVVAQRRADDMAKRDYFGHKTPEGLTGYVVELGKAGVSTWNWAGENLALNKGFPDPVRTAMDGLMKSQAHRSNILADTNTFTHIGVGYTVDPRGRHIFVQVFISGANQP